MVSTKTCLSCDAGWEKNNLPLRYQSNWTHYTRCRSGDELQRDRWLVEPFTRCAMRSARIRKIKSDRYGDGCFLHFFIFPFCFPIHLKTANSLKCNCDQICRFIQDSDRVCSTFWYSTDSGDSLAFVSATLATKMNRAKNAFMNKLLVTTPRKRKNAKRRKGQ